MDYLSTTSLANELDIPASELFARFKTMGWIDRVGDKWQLTQLGKQQGGQTRSNAKFGEYIVWPETINADLILPQDKGKLLNATAIGKHFGVSSQRMNLILSELGWIEKGISGWTASNLGLKLGGKQFEHDTSGASYVLWPASILQDKNLAGGFAQNIDKSPPSNKNEEAVSSSSFREKFEAKHRTQDGHYVRSRAEVIIDNALYQYGLVHAYERKLPVDEDVYSDFYLPSGKVYIEYWGMENDAAYADRKRKKIEIYKKYELRLIELNDEDIFNLDDSLPKKLLKFGIKVY